MKCKLVMADWRKFGKARSIYNTELGVKLSDGDLHSGTVFDAEVALPQEIEREIKEALKKHGAYPVFKIIPNLERSR